MQQAFEQQQGVRYDFEWEYFELPEQQWWIWQPELVGVAGLLL